jgi:hypothetical protein
MTEEPSTEEKKLLRMSPAETAAVVLDDILSNPENEQKVRKAIKDADAEIKDAYGSPAFLIGNIVCNAVYGTVMEPLTKMARSYQTQLYVPLGIVPTCGEIMSHECPEDAEVDPGELLVELGELWMRVFEGNYTLQTARENADAARTKASGSGEIVSVSTPARGMTPAGSISTESSYSGEHQSQDSQPSAAVDETPSAQRSPSQVMEIASSATREIETPAPSISLEKRVTPRQGMQ